MTIDRIKFNSSADNWQPTDGSRKWWCMSGYCTVSGTRRVKHARREYAADMADRIIAKASKKAPCLIMLTDMGFRIIPLRGPSPWLIGRNSSVANIVLNNNSVSGEHAKLVLDADNTWRCIDLLSLNGTFINERRHATAYLSHGDILTFGDVDTLLFLAKAVPRSIHVN